MSDERQASKRDEFAAKFGEADAALIEAAAESHRNTRAFDTDRGFGSDEFRWAVLMVLSFECLTRFRDSHGFTCEYADVERWLKEPTQRAWLAAHDGDVDYLAMLGGVYTPFMPEDSDAASSPLAPTQEGA